MLGFFESAPFEDDRLGLLKRSGGLWRGSIELGRHGKIGLSLSGGRQSPDPASLALAHELPARYGSLLSQIQASLFGHYEPYRDADSARELPEISEPFPKIARCRGGLAPRLLPTSLHRADRRFPAGWPDHRDCVSCRLGRGAHRRSANPRLEAFRIMWQHGLTPDHAQQRTRCRHTT